MIDKALFLVYNIIVVMSEDITGYMQTYRSGHNGADSKSVCGQPHVSSNLTVCAITGTYLFYVPVMAVKERFELSRRLPDLPHFECGPFNRLGTSPYISACF